MKKSLVAKLTALALTATATLSATAAYAEDWRYFNDGNGNCGYVSCGELGCSVVLEFPCPREVSGE